MTPMARQAADLTDGTSSFSAALIQLVKMKSCFSFGRDEKTEEVIPAKQVTDALLTFQG